MRGRFDIRRLAALVLIAASVGCSSERSMTEFFETEEKLYSQGNEELIIRHFFGDRRGGFFVDVGAYHWKDYSTTYYLEAHLGWTGIAIDANQDLGGGYRKHRPGTRFFSFIVTDHSGGKEDFYLAGPVSSTTKEHVEHFTDRMRLRKVETITLDDLLTRAGVEKVDFVSMDIELGEPAALAGFDIERFQPELVGVEAGNAVVREKIAPYFESHGYVRIDEYLPYEQWNWFYTPRRNR